MYGRRGELGQNERGRSALIEYLRSRWIQQEHRWTIHQVSIRSSRSVNEVDQIVNSLTYPQETMLLRTQK